MELFLQHSNLICATFLNWNCLTGIFSSYLAILTVSLLMCLLLCFQYLTVFFTCSYWSKVNGEGIIVNIACFSWSPTLLVTQTCIDALTSNLTVNVENKHKNPYGGRSRCCYHPWIKITCNLSASYLFWEMI